MNEMEAHRVAYATWEACSHESEVSGEVCLNCIAKTILAERTLAQQEARAELLEKVLQRVHHMANVWNLHPQAEREFTEAVRALLEGK